MYPIVAALGRRAARWGAGKLAKAIMSEAYERITTEDPLIAYKDLTLLTQPNPGAPPRLTLISPPSDRTTTLMTYTRADVRVPTYRDAELMIDAAELKCLRELPTLDAFDADFWTKAAIPANAGGPPEAACPPPSLYDGFQPHQPRRDMLAMRPTPLAVLDAWRKAREEITDHPVDELKMTQKQRSRAAVARARAVATTTEDTLLRASAAAAISAPATLGPAITLQPAPSTTLTRSGWVLR